MLPLARTLIAAAPEREHGGQRNQTLTLHLGRFLKFETPAA